MNTLFLLLAEFEEADVPLDRVAEKYFGLGPDKAKRMAAARTFPVPAYRAGESQKSTWLVRLSDLAEYLDGRRAIAKEEWALVQGHKSATQRSRH